MNSSASTSKRKPNKKKQLTTTKSPSKISGIQALLCKATTPTKLINKIENDVPTRISKKPLDMLSLTKKVKETCYFCQYSLFNNCSILQRKSRRNDIEFLVGWLDETPQLPDIDLINNLNYELLSQYANSTSDSEFSSGNEDEKGNKIANNLQVKENILSEIDKLISLRNENNLDDNVTIGDIQDKPHFNVEQELYKELKTKETLEYFGLSHIEDMFTGSDNEEAAGYQSDSTIIYSPNDPTKKVKSFYVISDSESDFEVNTDTCNDRKLLKKRHISESDSEGPVYKSKKSGHVDDLMKRNIASSASSCTRASTHADNKNKARDIETREERDNKFDDKDTVYESDNFMVLLSNIDSENNNDNMFRTLTREPNNESDNKGMFKSAYAPIEKNVFNSSSTKNSVDISRNEYGMILDSIIDISNNDRYLSNNTDMGTNGKTLKTQNIESVNEVQEIESANKEKTIASFTTNNTINLPFVDSENDVLNIETNLLCIVISDTDSDSDNNTDMNTNSKLKERNNDSNNEFQDIGSVNKGVNANITSFTSDKTIHFSLDENDNDIQVIETNIHCTVISDTDSGSENNIDTNTNSKLEQNNEPNHEADDVSASNKVVPTYAITDSDSD